jgi:catechol-2,3-dioxygenase
MFSEGNGLEVFCDVQRRKWVRGFSVMFSEGNGLEVFCDL